MEIEEFQNEFKEVIKQFRQQEKFNHERNTTIYPLEPIIAQIPSLLAKGQNADEIKRRILFQTMTHEFGHVLNLRHNFYGSFDASHWQREEKGQVVLRSSSVMDYLNLKDDVKSPLRGPVRPLR